SYGLILEPKTQFYNMYRKDQLKIPNKGVGEEMYEYLLKRMHETELHQYEFSNFGKKGHESEHNKVYWKNEGYYGFGAGISGFVYEEQLYYFILVNLNINIIQNMKLNILDTFYH